MKSGRYKYILLLLLAIKVFSNTGLSQENDTVLVKAKKVFTLPPLDTLIQAALENSGNYTFYQEALLIKQQELRLQHKDWFDYILLNGDVGYGTYDQIWKNQFSYDYRYNLLTSSKQVSYGASVTARFPLSVLINRNNNMQIAKHEVNKAEHEVEKAHEYVSCTVIDLYFQCLNDFTTQLIREEQLESSKFELQKAEKDFVDGIMTFSVYSVTTRNYYKAQIEYETSKNEFYKSLAKLELLTGVKLLKPAL
ncbi:MAG: TolC family protein [Bacteroidales bacterium]